MLLRKALEEWDYNHSIPVHLIDSPGGYFDYNGLNSFHVTVRSAFIPFFYSIYNEL